MTALVPNISKEILCRPTWVIQILLFKLIFPFLLSCYMSYIFDNCFSMFWRDLVYLFWLYFTHIWQPIYNVLSFKHFIWYDLSFCHTSHFAPGMWIFGFYSPLLIFSKLCLKLRGAAYLWVWLIREFLHFLWENVFREFIIVSLAVKQTQ